MSTKALKTQLLAAVAMVLVASVALGSSTYAWFATNTSVKADGMNITAKTEGANLEVSFTKDSFAAGTVAVTTTETAALLPTHYVTNDDKGTSGKYKDNNVLSAGEWAHAFSSKYDEVSSDSTYANATEVDAVGTLADEASKTNYALVVPVYLRLNEQSTSKIEDIKATATITHTDGNTEGKGMETAGRVAFITQNGAGSRTILDSKGYKNGETTDSPVASIEEAGNTGAKVVYAVIYFDGDDESCKSSMFDTDKYTVSLTFEGTVGGAISTT